MAGLVEGIFLAPAGGAQAKDVEVSNAIEGCGLKGDRYCTGTGHWSRFGRVCQVTFIAAEDLDDIERETGVSVKNGEHRRNVVTKGIKLEDFTTRRAVPCRGSCIRVPGAALGLSVYRRSYRTGYDAGSNGTWWYLRDGNQKRHDPDR